MRQDYSYSFAVTATPEMVFKAITEQINLWWTTATNEPKTANDPLRVEFGSDTFKVMNILEARPEKLLVWQVTEAHISHEELIEKDEWVGTTIHWAIHSRGSDCQIDFRHQGLTSEMECWDVCSNGWSFFLGSLKEFLDTGKGMPFEG